MLFRSQLASVYRENGVLAESFSTVEEGVGAAFWAAVKEKTPIVALGSLYMYGEVKASLKKLLP